MNLELTASIIGSYKRLSYTVWHALAEFIDNSTQAYFNHKSKLDKQFKKDKTNLTVKLEYNFDKDTIRIEDNSIGMNEAELKLAFRVGNPPSKPTGRSRYGLGMKTAAFWLGDNWTITTKKLGEERGVKVHLDYNRIVEKQNLQLVTKSFKAGKDEHYTIIEITSLHSKIQGRKLGKLKEHLGSMYRFDFVNYGLKLFWGSDLIQWRGFDNELFIQADGKPYKKNFAFRINGKRVTGWVGVLGKGFATRKKAGFSIIQNDRVIQGFPDAYKPTTVFGEQDDGVNDLVNQRVIGELVLEGFNVSHTKDTIVWTSDEEFKMEAALEKVCQEAVHLAMTARFRDKNNNISRYKKAALDTVSSELVSDVLDNFLSTVSDLPADIIRESYSRSAKSTTAEFEPDMTARIGHADDVILVKVYFNDKSEFEPYTISEVTVAANTVSVFINSVHPHFTEMTESESLTNFIRHCVYDGVAEWKAIKLKGALEPFTFRMIKDGLLRVPYQIKSTAESGIPVDAES